jgi:hypothetical protein
VNRWTALMSMVVAVTLVACGSGGGGGDSPTPPVTRPSSTAKLSILSPEPGAVIHGSEVLVKLDLTGGKITTVVSTDLKPDEGHIHLKLDGRTITLLGTLEATVTDLQPGDHVIEAEFVAADHGPFDPRVVTQVTFTVA